MFVTLQYLLPHHFLSRIVRLATHSRCSRWKNFLIRSFLKSFPVDMTEAAQPDPTAYPSFNEFFTRALRPGLRPIDAAAAAVASPVDGTVSEAGRIEDGRLLQAKGHSYTLEALLGEENKPRASSFPRKRESSQPSSSANSFTETFRGGEFATLYLAPHNYHRIHMPLDGRLVETRYIPGRLFSVNTATAQRVPGLFARNERVVCIFDSDAGRFAVILVGALFVGGMSTVWAGDITPARRRTATTLPSPPGSVELPKGAELGRFNMGSTVILLFEPGTVSWHSSLATGAPVRVGAAIGVTRP